MSILQSGITKSLAVSYDIDNSLRFNGADAAYLSRTPGSDGNRRTWTYSCWFKRSGIDVANGLASCLLWSGTGSGETDANTTLIYILPTGTHEDRLRITGAETSWKTTTKMFRDPSAWYHLVVTLDTTDSAAADRWKIWVNGTQITDFEISANPDLNEDLGINSTSPQTIGRYDTQQYYDGYLAEVYMIDGTALTPTSFAELDSTTNQWIPLDSDDVKDAVTFGTNGFYQKYDDPIVRTSFTSDTTWTVPAGVTSVDYLVVGGAGGGGGSKTGIGSGGAGGGGGSGGYRTGTLVVTPGAELTVTIGDGGAGGGRDVQGVDGDESVLGSITSEGGGGGGKRCTAGTNAPSGGGSGGGAGGSCNGTVAGGTGSTYGNDAGLTIYEKSGGGGGGSAAVGANAPSNSAGGAGGAGTSNDISGSAVTYGVGGTGGFQDNHAAGAAGAANTGNGGGGAAGSGVPGGTGGSGIVVIKYGTGFGKDSSGEDNTFTVTNLVATDKMIDTPTNNFCTINALTESITNRNDFSEGNLRANANDISGNSSAWFTGTIGIPYSTGKYYWEFADEVYIDADAFGGTYADGWGMGLIADDGNAPLMADNDISNTGWWFSKSNNNVGTSRARGGGTSSENKRVPSTTTGVFKCCYDSDNGNFHFGGDLGWTSSSTTATPNTDAQPDSDNDLWDSGTGVGFSGYTVLPAFATINAGGNLSQLRFNFGQDSSFAGLTSSITGTAGNPSGGGYRGNTDSEGRGDFFYEVPTGYKALCTLNLSTPEIKLPGENFSTVLYTGNGSTQSITGAGFQPDVIWIKNREITENHFIASSLQDADGNKYLYVNLTSIEGDRADGVTSIDADGFSLGAWGNNNTVSDTHVSWLWKAGGALTADNSAGVGAVPTAGSVKIDGSNLGSALAGTIAATRISANTTSGFSVVQFVGNQTSGATVAHGLSSAPTMIFLKSMDDADQWTVYVAAEGNTKALYLNLNNAKVTSTGFWNDTTPTASVFSLGNDTQVNKTGSDFIAYCFHSIEGYSSADSYYKGNGNANGPFIYLGFTPKFVIAKNIDLADDWEIYDGTMNPYNYLDLGLKPNTNGAEYALNTNNRAWDFLSNGFKVRGTNAGINTNDDSILYLAFAESPFKYSNAR